MSNVSDKAELSSVLRTVLADLILQGEQPAVTSADDIDDDQDFREYGITSVDFLEYVLSLEQRLDTSIPDEAFTEASLLTINDWVNYLTER